MSTRHQRKRMPSKAVTLASHNLAQGPFLYRGIKNALAAIDMTARGPKAIFAPLNDPMNVDPKITELRITVSWLALLIRSESNM